MNTHFDYIGKEAGIYNTALLKQKAFELGKNLPVIISGDFNCLREGPPYSTLMD